MCMASRMAPSIRRSRSAGVISPRSACSRKIAQMRWSASSTVSTVITVPTSSPGVPPRMGGRGRGFSPYCAAALLPHEDQPEPELRLWPRRARRPMARQWHAAVAGAPNGLDTRDRREPLNRCFVVERVTGIEPAQSAWELYGAERSLPAYWLTCGPTFPLTVRDRDCPRWLLRSGTYRARPGRPVLAALRSPPEEPTVFKSVRDYLSATVATWAFSGRAHQGTQDHPLYILRAVQLLIRRMVAEHHEPVSCVAWPASGDPD